MATRLEADTLFVVARFLSADDILTAAVTSKYALACRAVLSAGFVLVGCAVRFAWALASP
jgi:hypothetical protein